MPYFREITSGDDVARFVEESGRPVKTLGTAMGGAPVQVVRLGGDRKPAVVIKGGSHATEIGGIHAALTLITEGIDTDREVHVIPCGDPFGYGGYRRALSHAVGEAVSVSSDDECLSALERVGRRFYEGEHFALYHVGDLVFAWADQK
ncbi:MAG: hypothetical protein ACYTAN_14930, partial [Planctomycetota bacterium]